MTSSDGTSPVAPLFVFLGLFGLFLLAAIPPLGVIFLIVAFGAQRRLMKNRRREREAHTAKLAQRERRERILFFKGL